MSSFKAVSFVHLMIKLNVKTESKLGLDWMLVLKNVVGQLSMVRVGVKAILRF